MACIHKVSFALAIALLSASCARVPDPLPAEAMVDGKRVDAYPTLWWQWMFQRPPGPDSPTIDTTGAQCAKNQSGKVWFLVGTNGHFAAKRECHVPSGTYLFLPLLNVLNTPVAGQAARKCWQAQAATGGINETAKFEELSLDGKDIDGLKLQSQCFNPYASADYVTNSSSYFPSATSGYWLMLPPLSKGRHSLRVDARYDRPDFPMHQMFEFELVVE